MTEDHDVQYDDSTSPLNDGGTSSDERAGRVEDVSADSPEDERVAQLMEHSLDIAVFVPAVETLEPADAADALEDLDVDDAADVVHEMRDEVSARDLAEMQIPIAVTVLEDLTEEHGPEEPARYLSIMDPDEAVDILQACPDDLRDQLLAALPPAKTVQLEQLSRYDPETAAGMMTTEFVKVPSGVTIKEAIAIIRSQPDTEFLYLYCVDGGERLVGMLSPRDLLVSDPTQCVKEVMDRHVDYLRPDVDRELVADAFERYDYTVMPVVDPADRLLGVVTVDDVLDIIREEHTEDAYKMVGAGVGEAVFSSLLDKFRGRFPWLVVNLFTSFVAAIVVFRFESLIGKLAILAVLMPVIANQAGNAGHQSLAVTLRGLVLGEVRGRRVWPLVWRELALGLLTGLIVGVAVCVGIMVAGATGLASSVDWHLGAVAAFAMTISMGVGCLVGTAMPLLMTRIGRDPATASTIFLTMMTDTVSFLTFLGVAWVFQGILIPGA